MFFSSGIVSGAPEHAAYIIALTSPARMAVGIQKTARNGGQEDYSREVPISAIGGSTTRKRRAGFHDSGSRNNPVAAACYVLKRKMRIDPSATVARHPALLCHSQAGARAKQPSHLGSGDGSKDALRSN
jgi:hypothetical protein